MKRVITIVALVASIVVYAVAAGERSEAGATACRTSCSMPMMTSAMPAMHGTGPHMTMTPKTPASPGDRQRADRIVVILRAAIAKYKDYRVAEQDGYAQFLPTVPQAQYHLTNWRNAVQAQFAFDPAKPTSLHYRTTGGGFELVGAMYTAPKTASLGDLNARVPLSVAQWHEHVNFCKGPRDAGRDAYFGPRATFGLAGSIATADGCRAAGGTFFPVIFNWMVHIYPFESNAAAMWGGMNDGSP